jgi:hypothetical protein
MEAEAELVFLVGSGKKREAESRQGGGCKRRKGEDDDDEAKPKYQNLLFLVARSDLGLGPGIMFDEGISYELAAQGYCLQQYVVDSSAAIQGPGFSSFSPLKTTSCASSAKLDPCNLCFFPTVGASDAPSRLSNAKI